jgi:hypothetical protein
VLHPEIAVAVDDQVARRRQVLRQRDGRVRLGDVAAPLLSDLRDLPLALGIQVGGRRRDPRHARDERWQRLAIQVEHPDLEAVGQRDVGARRPDRERARPMGTVARTPSPAVHPMV